LVVGNRREWSIVMFTYQLEVVALITRVNLDTMEETYLGNINLDRIYGVHPETNLSRMTQQLIPFKFTDSFSETGSFKYQIEIRHDFLGTSTTSSCSLGSQVTSPSTLMKASAREIEMEIL